jgi:hypothetical protein
VVPRVKKTRDSRRRQTRLGVELHSLSTLVTSAMASLSRCLPRTLTPP